MVGSSDYYTEPEHAQPGPRGRLARFLADRLTPPDQRAAQQAVARSAEQLATTTEKLIVAAQGLLDVTAAVADLHTPPRHWLGTVMLSVTTLLAGGLLVTCTILGLHSSAALSIAEDQRAEARAEEVSIGQLRLAISALISSGVATPESLTQGKQLLDEIPGLLDRADEQREAAAVNERLG
jgi:hypothetical protein